MTLMGVLWMRSAKRILAVCNAIVCLSIWIAYEIKQASNVKLTEGLEKIDLRILYVGHPASDREKDFVWFLKEHFRQVRTGDLANFKEELTKGFDVIILDYDGDGFKAPRPRLSSEYTRPTVTVGVAGAHICGSMSLKTGYL
jgi:hypothetical protein